MPDRAEPRWLTAASAAAYVEMTEAAFRQRVTAGIFPRPNYAAGSHTPRWDRLALDAAFGAGADSTDARIAVQGLIDEIAAKGQKGATSRAPRDGRRVGQGIPLQSIPAQATRQAD